MKGISTDHCFSFSYRQSLAARYYLTLIYGQWITAQAAEFQVPLLVARSQPFCHKKWCHLQVLHLPWFPNPQPVINKCLKRPHTRGLPSKFLIIFFSFFSTFYQFWASNSLSCGDCKSICPEIPKTRTPDEEQRLTLASSSATNQNHPGSNCSGAGLFPVEEQALFSQIPGWLWWEQPAEFKAIASQLGWPLVRDTVSQQTSSSPELWATEREEKWFPLYFASWSFCRARSFQFRIKFSIVFPYLVSLHLAIWAGTHRIEISSWGLTSLTQINKLYNNNISGTFYILPILYQKRHFHVWVKLLQATVLHCTTSLF